MSNNYCWAFHEDIPAYEGGKQQDFVLKIVWSSLIQQTASSLHCSFFCFHATLTIKGEETKQEPQTSLY